MKTYIYDNTFSSLMSLISYLIEVDQIPDDIKNEKKYIQNLLDEPVYLNLKEKELINSLKKKIPNNLFHTLYYVYLSEEKNKEMIIYEFVKKTLLYKNQIMHYLNIDCVYKVNKIANYVSRENHRMKGFLRFKKMSNFYYAEIEPTNNIIYILINHFKTRLSNEYWIIKDNKRNIYAIYDKKKVKIMNEKEIVKLNLAKDEREEAIENLWKTFFKTVTIKERKNRKCQMNFMPKKYWKNMLEMEDNYERDNKK